MGLSEAGPVEPLQPPITLVADDEIPVRVECLARPDHIVPPAGILVSFMEPGGVGISGEGVEDQDGVRPVAIEGAVSFIGERDR